MAHALLPASMEFLNAIWAIMADFALYAGVRTLRMHAAMPALANPHLRPAVLRSLLLSYVKCLLRYRASASPAPCGQSSRSTGAAITATPLQRPQQGTAAISPAAVPTPADCVSEGALPGGSLGSSRSPRSGSADQDAPQASSPSELHMLAAAQQVGARPQPERMRCARRCPACLRLPVPLQGCDEACRPSVAGDSAVVAHDLGLLQVADERALVLVGPPRTGALTERACRAATEEDISEADRARELGQIAVDAMRAYCQ